MKAGKITKLFEGKYNIDEDAVQDAVKNESRFNIIHNETLLKIDFIVRKNQEYRAVEFARRKTVSLSGTDIYIVSLEDLILSKLYWARDTLSEIQINDVKNLLQNKYDKEYLDTWARKLKISELLGKCRNG